MRRVLLPLLALVAGAAAPAPDPEDAKAPIPAGFYRLVSAVKLAGKSPDWDYLAFDVARQRLFIARRGSGLWVFDTARQRLLTRVANTEGSGATLLLPALGRGYSTNEDGSFTVFSLATLAPISRVKFADDADAASYDLVTGRIAFVSADSKRVTLVDARSLKTVGVISLDTKKADASAADGSGHILLNERDKNMVAQIDAGSAKITAEWPISGCEQPTGMAIDTAHHRAFIGCRGAKPVLAVIDSETGKAVTILPLGRGNDGVIFDTERQRIITTNGVEANIVVFHQDSADSYRFEQAVTTRPNARTIAFDNRRQRIFTVTAEGVVNPAQRINSGPAAFYPNAYYDNSFVVLTYALPQERN